MNSPRPAHVALEKKLEGEGGREREEGSSKRDEERN